jgi:hypothetical protein
MIVERRFGHPPAGCDLRLTQSPSSRIYPFRANQYLKYYLNLTIQHLLSVKDDRIESVSYRTLAVKNVPSIGPSPPAGISHTAALEAHFLLKVCLGRTPSCRNASRSQWRPDPSVLIRYSPAIQNYLSSGPQSGPFSRAAGGGRRGPHTAWSDLFPLPLQPRMAEYPCAASALLHRRSCGRHNPLAHRVSDGVPV